MKWPATFLSVSLWRAGFALVIARRVAAIRQAAGPTMIEMQTFGNAVTACGDIATPVEWSSGAIADALRDAAYSKPQRMVLVDTETRADQQNVTRPPTRADFDVAVTAGMETKCCSTLRCQTAFKGYAELLARELDPVATT